ncbi:MAG: hypothetical protein HKN85_07630 [Gammaproteobacteria bacterium]|nr:hypothetical protein [Gammaproteobacteria bacterium]
MEFIRRNLEQIFWFCILVSWIPLVCGFSVSLTNIEHGEDGYVSYVLMPEPAFINYYVVSWLSVLFILTIPISFALRRQFVARETEKFLRSSKKKQLPAEEQARINRQTPHYLLATLPLMLAATIPFFANSPEFNPWSQPLHFIYLLAVAISFYLYMRYAHLISSAFVIFMSVLMLDSILLFVSHVIQYSGEEAAVESHYSVFGILFNVYAIDILKVFVFVLFMALVRIIYLAWVDNRKFLKETGKEWRSHTTQTFGLWYPALLIFVVFSLIYQLLYSWKIEPAMVSQVMGCVEEGEQIAAENNQGFPPFNCEDDMYEEGELISLDAALQKSNKRKMDLLSGITTAKIDSFQVGVVEGTGSAADAIYADINASVPKRLPGTKTRDCGINIICLIENAIKSAVNSGYVSVKNRQLRKLRGELDELEATVGKDSPEFAAKARELVKAELTALQRMNKTAISSTSNSIKSISKLLLIYSLILLLKTFMIVYSRISFARHTTNFVSFATDNDPPARGTLKKRGATMTLTKAGGAYFCSRHTVVVDGPPEDRVTPQRWTAFFARLFTQHLAMNRVDPAKYSGKTTVDVDAPSQLVEWSLKDQERVIFNFADFAAMSEGVVIERRVSLSISTLILGRAIQYCAVGPGKLVLKTTANAVLVKGDDNGQVPSLNASNLVAWNVCSNFDVDANLDIKNTFMSPDKLTPRSNTKDLVIFDKSVRRASGRVAGILRFMKSFLLPI